MLRRHRLFRVTIDDDEMVEAIQVVRRDDLVHAVIAPTMGLNGRRAHSRPAREPKGAVDVEEHDGRRRRTRVHGPFFPRAHGA